eukprot:scaffold200982_cov32-Tisochrysis_lutea.AAC.3
MGRLLRHCTHCGNGNGTWDGANLQWDSRRVRSLNRSIAPCPHPHPGLEYVARSRGSGDDEGLHYPGAPKPTVAHIVAPHRETQQTTKMHECERSQELRN